MLDYFFFFFEHVHENDEILVAATSKKLIPNKTSV